MYSFQDLPMVVVLIASTIVAISFGFGWIFYQSVFKKSQSSHASHRVHFEERDAELGDLLQENFGQRTKDSTDAPILEPKHKIFLSHSGSQKEFVEFLCKALEDRWHYPFFDRRHESLPKGERFPELIIQAAQQCEMLIVVVSDDYFMSKWPMLELNAFVKAHELSKGSKYSNGGPKILPLFYGLSVNDLEDKRKQSRWVKKWKALAKDDNKKRILVSDWKNALDVLRSFNGVVYDKVSKKIVAYVEEVVAVVDKTIIRDIRWDDSHVQGKSNIYKAIAEKIKSLGVSGKYYLKVLGIHGVGGIGKTTACKTLANELMREYEGRVCHIEFQGVSVKDSIELFQKVVVDLTKRSKEKTQELNEGECKHILRASLPKYKVFLAIDNVSDDFESKKYAKMFLEAASYHKESLVIVTTRSKSVLEHLGIRGDACMEMPEIGQVDAMNLFLHQAARGKKFVEDEDTKNILKCINRCYFSKGFELGKHYHPLALEALGLLLGELGESPLEWVQNLARVRTFGDMSRQNPVFDVLRSSFDMLQSSEQSFFMDVAFFFKGLGYNYTMSYIEWLCSAHKEEELDVIHRLEALKRKGLLQDVDVKSGRVRMHDLYYEFAELEARGSFHESTNLKERKWVYVDNGDVTDLEREPAGRCWENPIRLAILQSAAQMGKLDGIKWEYFPNVQILQLNGVRFNTESVNVSRMVGLRSLELRSVSELSRLEGLANLKNLTRFICSNLPSVKIGAFVVDQLPSSLKTLQIFSEDVVFGSDVLARCNNLSDLYLDGVETSSLDVSNCSSLKTLHLSSLPKLQTLSGLATSRPSNLHVLEVVDCDELVDIPGIHHLLGLKRIFVCECAKWEVPSLQALTNLESLRGDIQRLVLRANDCIPRQIRELGCLDIKSSEGLNFVGFNQLTVLNLQFNSVVTSFGEWGDLPALQILDLSYCKVLLRLPDLSGSRSLQDLILEGCDGLELHETDIQMLSELPSLQPVRIDDRGKGRVDLVRRKLLIHSCKGGYCYVPQKGLQWKEHEWEERELPAPPFALGVLAREYK